MFKERFGVARLSKYQLEINEKIYSVDVDPDLPLLWLLRDVLGMVGTKYGCGIGQCGACTVHVDGVAVRSCLTRISEIASKPIRTIEGLAEPFGLHPLQRAWIEHDVAQCGYCQAGQIMTAAALLEQNASPTDEEIESALAGNYCRCGTYNRILSAVKSVSQQSMVQEFDPQIEFEGGSV